MRFRLPTSSSGHAQGNTWTAARLLCLAFAVVSLLASHVASATATQTWAERLGYQSGKRVLILYAAQMGVLFETNKAGRDLLAQELCQSAEQGGFIRHVVVNRAHGVEKQTDVLRLKGRSQQ